MVWAGSLWKHKLLILESCVCVTPRSQVICVWRWGQAELISVYLDTWIYTTFIKTFSNGIINQDFFPTFDVAFSASQAAMRIVAVHSALSTLTSDGQKSRADCQIDELDPLKTFKTL